MYSKPEADCMAGKQVNRQILVLDLNDVKEQVKRKWHGSKRQSLGPTTENAQEPKIVLVHADNGTIIISPKIRL